MSDLRLRSVTVTFAGRAALREVDLTVAPQQVHGLVGPNGAGKTTLFDVACGLVQPDQGEVLRDGKAVGRLRPRELPRLRMARTWQDLVLDDKLSVLHNVMLGADHHPRPGVLASLLPRRPSGQDDPARRDDARRVITELGLGAHVDDLPAGLPPALRKRVDLARALVTGPDLLLLDEPFGGLSDAEKAELATILGRLSRRMSVLLIEHDLPLMMRVCDEITALDNGSVIAHGSPEEVANHPAVRAAYLDLAAGDD